MTVTHQDVLTFWFEELKPGQWFATDEDVDEAIRTRFGECHDRAIRCECAGWRVSPQGRLAEVIVLDQFSRNLYRGSAQAFAHDALALALAQEAVAQGLDSLLSAQQRTFMYMPYMHSESLPIHAQGLELFEANGIESNIEFHRRHTEILRRFGRYPHRNHILGRTSRREEIEFLRQPGSGF